MLISVAEEATAEAIFEPPTGYLREVRGVATPTATATSEPSPTPEPEPDAKAPDPRIGQLQAFFGSRPLGPYAEAMIVASDAYGIDWRLLPVISILESSGGLQACGGNAWGYAACRVRFGSFDEGIHVVAAALARSPYAGHSTAAVLCIWVSGTACTNSHGVDYAYRAFSVYASLGGWFALPPRPASDTVVVEPTGTPAPTSTTAPAPEPSPTPSPEPTATPEATATPEPTPTAQTTAAPATSTPEAEGTVAAVEGQPTP